MQTIKKPVETQVLNCGCGCDHFDGTLTPGGCGCDH